MATPRTHSPQARGHAARESERPSSAQPPQRGPRRGEWPHHRDNRPIYTAAKRITDVLIALLVLLVLAPIWIMAALLVKLTSQGPVLYSKGRCGRDGKLFACYKFRTMYDGADSHRWQLEHLNEMSGPVFKVAADPRITPVGRWLRRLSIDELPQTLNVLKGNMSIVGPRPPLPGEVAQYTAREWGRLAVKPGLTCLWQIKGRSLIRSFDEWVELDLEYVRRCSFWYDWWIILQTPYAVLTMRGAC